MSPAELMALWDVTDAAKTHVAFEHKRLTEKTHRHQAAASWETLRRAVEALGRVRETDDPGEAPSGAWDASPEQQAALGQVATDAGAYVDASARYRAFGTGRADVATTLVALCKALDVVTFYRNGPQVREEGEAAPNAALHPLTSPSLPRHLRALGSAS